MINKIIKFGGSVIMPWPKVGPDNTIHPQRFSEKPHFMQQMEFTCSSPAFKSKLPTDLALQKVSVSLKLRVVSQKIGYAHNF